MLLTNQPLAAVTNETYREKMAEFDPSFVVPGEQKIKTMIVKSCKYNQQNLQNLLTETAENVSLTMDLWSSKAKHGYLGVTATWITPNFEIKDVMLEINYVPSPHSSEVVANELYKCIKNWNLESRVISITTDNGSNMVSMFPLLNRKSGCENIQRLPCTAHTIQLAIGKGLAPAEILVARAKRLIRFFQYQKQVERLEQVQRKLGYVDIMRCIQDVSTRWNSSYYAWDRLFFLKDAIIQLQADLCTSTDRESKKNGSKLKRILLSDEEWDLLDQLVDLLMPFENATREFSGNTYITLSRTIPTIKERIFDLAAEVPSNAEEEFPNENTVFETEIEIQPINFDDDEVISNITKKSISIKNPLDTTGVLEKVKQNIYNALIYYWNIPSNLGLMAALLDPRYKNLDFLEIDDEKEQIIQKLRNEIGEVEVPGPEILDNPAPSQDIDSSIRSQKEYRQRRQKKIKKAVTNVVISDEVTNYLSLPLALETEDPLNWWKIRSQNFPKLAKFARKYLAIPATSVSSERLFSDAGNLISAKRTNLDTKLVGQMLFLKRNIKTMQVFAPEWDGDETDHIEID
jgi:zinc finger BED domain-containing protein 1 (E3 SUMO-protein ligase ZBED1)